MPNIIINKNCNLRCPYCFASNMLKETDNKNITLDQLDKILTWLSTTPPMWSLGVIGGEPTLHPQFEDIIYKINNFCEIYNVNSILFTNGIEANKYLHLLNNSMAILINTNNLDYNLNLKNKFLKTTSMIHDLGWFETNNPKATLGCNIYFEEKNYNYFWRVVDLYPEIKRIRCSIVSPTKEYDKQHKNEYYLKMKKLFLDFLDQAEKRNLQIVLDCNKIPICYFSEEEYLKIKSLNIDYPPRCSPTIDINSDFKASNCFGTYDDLIDCNLFNNIDELENYFQLKMFQQGLLNNDTPCNKCQKLSLLQCQGGCLNFVKKI